ncbi:MAG: GlmU family protein [Chitinophagales bacterium]|nr:GlmU family protein [Chitinophagales bacterium]
MAVNKYILFDDEARDYLLPFTFTRCVADIRIGILTIREKWEKILQQDCGILTPSYLQPKYPYSSQPDSIFINASVLPDNALLNEIQTLNAGQVLVGKNQKTIAVYPDTEIKNASDLYSCFDSYERKVYRTDLTNIKYPWDIFTFNGQEIRVDIQLMKLEPNGHILAKDNRVKNPENIYVEEGVTAFWTLLNAENGPIYLGKDSTVMENALIRGSFALCEHATVKASAKIYEDTTIGPHSKVGGEVENSVILGYSNKGHDGYLGNSVLGEWCNLGADTNNSNLKNNYSFVRAWSYPDKKSIDTNLQFCGLLMGDHSKSGINTMFNTGTVVGVSSNIYGGGFPKKFVPSFSWGSSEKMDTYDFDKALDTARKMMARRHIELTEVDENILRTVFERSANYK